MVREKYIREIVEKWITVLCVCNIKSNQKFKLPLFIQITRFQIRDNVLKVLFAGCSSTHKLLKKNK